MTTLGLAITTAIWAALAHGAAAPAAREVSPETLAALDPTRLAALTCRGATGAVLVERLSLARDFAASRPAGRGPLPLYPGISRSDLELKGIEGDARRYFDQGLVLSFGFNHAAAIRSFREAQRLAPDCAMCWWGEALAHGPNINAPMDPAQLGEAIAALDRARRAAAGAGQLERDLIGALTLRYSADPGANRAALDAAYADAMLKVAARHPQSDAIAVLAAEAAMDTRPWDYWDAGRRQPQGRIGEAIALIEGVMARRPDHIQAAHLYIHLMENYADPRRAEAAADRLVAATPAQVGHLVHMPAHIFYRVGRYRDSIRANVLAARADEAFLAGPGDDGLYRFGYYPHNIHFIVASAQMAGDMRTAVGEARRLAKVLDADTAARLPWVQAIHAAPAFALTQFASARDILAQPAPDPRLAYVQGMWHYSRAVARARAHDRRGFDAELEAIALLAEAPATRAMVELGVPGPDLLRLASSVARGRFAYSAGRYDEAADHYRAALAIERTLPYNEPPYWYYPVSQSLGAALYRAKDYEGARAAFQAALVAAPANGWALYGLGLTERRLGHRAEAAAAEAALARAWLGDRRWLKLDRL